MWGQGKEQIPLDDRLHTGIATVSCIVTSACNRALTATIRSCRRLFQASKVHDVPSMFDSIHFTQYILHTTQQPGLYDTYAYGVQMGEIEVSRYVQFHIQSLTSRQRKVTLCQQPRHETRQTRWNTDTNSEKPRLGPTVSVAGQQFSIQYLVFSVSITIYSRIKKLTLPRMKLERLSLLRFSPITQVMYRECRVSTDGLFSSIPSDRPQVKTRNIESQISCWDRKRSWAMLMRLRRIRSP